MRIALQFGPAEIALLILLGLLAGSTLARFPRVKGVAMTVLGLMIGIVGSDIETGAQRFTFGLTDLDDGVELVALALGMFGVAEFMNSVNQQAEISTKYSPACACATCAPTREDIGRSILPDVARHHRRQPVLADSRHRTNDRVVRRLRDREEDLAQRREKFGTSMIEGVVSIQAPEASTHSSVQGDFIPTMSLGIPGDAVMALLLGALMIQGIVLRGHQLISQHPDARVLGPWSRASGSATSCWCCSTCR